MTDNGIEVVEYQKPRPDDDEPLASADRWFLRAVVAAVGVIWGSVFYFLLR